MYGQSNVAVTGTHSHSGPAAWLNYLLPQITSKGFDKQSYQAIVDGGVLSVKRAHESLAPGYLSQGSKKVFGANINRSLYAYLNNPEEERARYNVSSTDDGQVEKDLTMLKFSDLNGNGRGVLTWFPVHGTSMLGNNTLVTGDNKGVAAYLFEKAQPAGFVAGFSQANVGDTTPNVEGAWCEDGTGVQCDFQKSVCSDGTSKYCHGRGPFFRETPTDNGAASCFEIGRLQVEAALELYSELDASASVQGGTVKSFHLFHDMSTFQFALPNGTNVRTCPAALGYSFAAGTTDGPGLFDFTQNDPGKPDANPIWAVVSGILKAPSKAQKACHWPKPILLDVGEIKIPYQWTPNIVDVQVLRVGNFFIIVSPGEATTMAGRRWKAAIGEKAKSLGLLASGQEPVVVIGGPANTYTHYISTPEEYAIQRYEGASTLYGPWTLPAYIKVSTENLEHLAEASTEGPPPGPTPPDHRGKSLSFITGVVYDNPPLGKKFGQVRTQVQASYRPGQSVEVSFVGANPRNNLKLEGTYVAVEKQSPDGGFVQVLDDEDWEVVMHWRRLDGLLGSSEVRVVWEVPEGVERGKYRIRYFGDAKQPVTKRIVGFEGASGLFDIV
jgi:neutral ceramidase